MSVQPISGIGRLLQARLLANPHQRLALEELGLDAERAKLLSGMLDARKLRPASVLVAVLQREAGDTVLLTRRTADMPDHAGQISFPGGKRHAEDADARATALREAEEEVGLPASSVEVFGYLPDYPTLSGFHITPVVGVVRDPPAFRVAAREVDTLIELPLEHALQVANYVIEEGVRSGVRLPYYVLQWQDHRVWGATAGMLRLLAQQLGARPLGETI